MILDHHFPRIFIMVSLLMAVPEGAVLGQQNLTLSQAVSTARERSVEALSARHSFVSAYWAYKTYQASRLPSLSLYGGLMNYDRSLKLLQSYDDGSFRYVATESLQNSIGLKLSQNIGLTGGTLSLYSDLSRIDQFGENASMNWYSQPVTIYYSQPLFSYNSFKWSKLVEPKEYEKGKRTYLESMEKISLKTAQSFFDLYLAIRTLETSRNNLANTKRMCSLAEERLELGSVTRDEYLQLRLKVLTDSLSIRENEVEVRKAQMALNSLLGYNEDMEIEPVIDDEIPDIQLDYYAVYDKTLKNSTFFIGNDISLLLAESDVAKAKADRGLTMAFSAKFGLSKTNPEFSGVYRNLDNQEVVGLTFSVPIFDWGLGKGKVQKAKAAQDVVRAQVEQDESNYRRQLFMLVGQFNNQRSQCLVSGQAYEIAGERFNLMVEKFKNGSATVTQMVDAQKDSDAALTKYVTDLNDFWNYYYTIRSYTLYDFAEKRSIEVDFMEMIR